MSYLRHFRANIKVVLKCLVLAFFHLAHALLPIKITDHKYWSIGKEKEHEKFYCWICHTFNCRSRLHKRMAKNAIKYDISKWQFYSAENKSRLIKEGHFKCPTFRRSYEQTEVLLKGRLAIIFGFIVEWFA